MNHISSPRVKRHSYLTVMAGPFWLWMVIIIIIITMVIIPKIRII